MKGLHVIYAFIVWFIPGAILFSQDLDSNKIITPDDSILILDSNWQAKVDSLNFNIISLKKEIDLLKDSLSYISSHSENLELSNQELYRKIDKITEQMHIKDSLVEAQLQSLKETEAILAEKETIYKNLLYTYKMDSLELSLKLESKNIELKSQKNVTGLLEESIEEKKTEIGKINDELIKTKQNTEKTQAEITFLKDTITNLKVQLAKQKLENGFQKTQLNLRDVKIGELNKEIYECLNKDKKKQVRVVQGVAFKTFRTPEYELAPSDVNNLNRYVINNNNAGNFEIDYITGASIKITELFKTSETTTSDLSLFVGIGGKDILKNYYLAPNISFFSSLNISFGLNIHEYETLKHGFNVGDELAVGTPIPTDNQWKINGYLGITLDLAVASGVFSKK